MGEGFRLRLVEGEELYNNGSEVSGRDSRGQDSEEAGTSEKLTTWRQMGAFCAEPGEQRHEKASLARLDAAIQRGVMLVY
jgi:hypothetical protein